MKALVMTALLVTAGLAQADQKVELQLAGPDGPGKSIGTVTLEQTPYGALLTPDLADLPPGVHGFHLHQRPSCDAAEENGKSVPAGAAGATGIRRRPTLTKARTTQAAIAATCQRCMSVPTARLRLQFWHLDSRWTISRSMP